MELYEADFYAWTCRQAELLRAGRFAEADIGHLVEEIESMGRSEKRELESRLELLLMHLLKWQHQPSHRGASWQASIDVQRDAIAEHLGENPSLQPRLPELIAAAYRRARIRAAAETGLGRGSFPEIGPWGFEQIAAVDFLPE